MISRILGYAISFRVRQDDSGGLRHFHSKCHVPHSCEQGSFGGKSHIEIGDAIEASVKCFSPHRLSFALA